VLFWKGRQKTNRKSVLAPVEYPTLADIRDRVGSEQDLIFLLDRGFMAAIGHAEPKLNGPERRPVPIPAAFWRAVRIDWLTGRVSSTPGGAEYADVRVVPNPLASLDVGMVRARHAYLFLEEALACVGSSMELLRALSEGYVTADGYRTYEGVKSSNTMRFEIPPDVFLNGEIDWFGRRIIEQTTRHTLKPTKCVWEEVRMPRSELEIVFPYVVNPFNQQANKRAASPGAPTKINWDPIWTLVILIVNDPVRPKSLKEFVRLILDRCQNAPLDPLPDESTIRRKFGDIWKLLQ
jgi:hypothetical protein